MTTLHQPKQVLNLARLLADKVMEIAATDVSCYQIDDAVAIAHLLMREVEYREVDING